MKTVRERISKLVEKWYITEPLFFAAWSLHTLIPSANVKTIRCGAGKVEYNPDFINALTKNQLYDVLCFEAMRIILKHPYSRKKEIDAVAYQASNITVQEYLRTSLGFKYAKEVFATTAFDRKHFEFYYDKLLEMMQTAATAQDSANADNTRYSPGSTAPNSGTGAADSSNKKSSNGKTSAADGSEAGISQGSRNTDEDDDADDSDDFDDTDDNDDTYDADDLDDSDDADDFDDTNDSDGTGDSGREHSTGDSEGPSYADLLLQDYVDKNSGKENCENWEKNDYYENLINEKITDAKLSNKWGYLSRNAKEIILATLKPKLDYRSILKSFRASVLSVSRRLTRMKPCRRYDFQYMGSKRDFTTRLLFAVDVSGSISNKDLVKGFSIVNRFFKYGIEQVDVIAFDTEIKGEKLSLKKARKEIKVVGRGGTSFQPVLDYLDKNREYDGLIIFTDGYAPVPRAPQNRKTRIVWLFNNESNYDYMKNSLQRLGKVAFVKEK